MTDAPERIWAVPERNCTVYMSGNSPITAQDGPFNHHRHGTASEYIRADLDHALETEIERLREALKDILSIPNSEAAQGIMKCLARAALEETKE